MRDVRVEYRSKSGEPAVRVARLSGLEVEELLASFAADAKPGATITLRCAHDLETDCCNGAFTVQAWRVRSIVELPGGAMLYERRPTAATGAAASGLPDFDAARAVLGDVLERLLANAAGRDSYAPGALMVQAFKETSDELGPAAVSQVFAVFLMRLQSAAHTYDRTPS